jgi:hypothetical protein
VIERVILLVEGQTEERFVKDFLAPYFGLRGLSVTATLLVTKKVKNGPNFKGGVTSFGKLENDIRRVLQGAGDARVSTIIDYYGLPKDCPGLNTRPPGGKPLERVMHVEDELRKYIADSRFRPFLALHEYEAWLFTDGESLPTVIDASKEEAQRFAALCSNFPNPEDIDDGPDTAPSKRIKGIFPSYKKTLHGPLVVEWLTLDRIRASCPHFGDWLAWLET